MTLRRRRSASSSSTSFLPAVVVVLVTVVVGSGWCCCSASSTTSNIISNDNDDNNGATYDEELYLQPLDDSLVLAVYNFALSEKDDSSSSSAAALASSSGMHSVGFPRAFSHLSSSVPGFESLEFSLASGRWQKAQWGTNAMPRMDFPYGARVAVVFDDDAQLPTTMNKKKPASLADRWEHIIVQLAGLFCASLSHMTFEEAIVTRLAGSGRRVRVEAVLSRERVCTENLTPFNALMPCGNRAGLGRLTDPLTIFRGPSHSMSVHLRREQERDRDGESSRFLVLEQTLAAVLPHDGVTTRGDGNDKPPPSVAEVLGVGQVNVGGDAPVWRACPVASASTLFVAPSPWAQGGERAAVTVHPLSAVDTVTLQFSPRPRDESGSVSQSGQSSSSSSSSLDVHRFASPRSRERGTISTRVHNTDNGGTTVVFNYRESFPWMIKV